MTGRRRPRRNSTHPLAARIRGLLAALPRPAPLPVALLTPRRNGHRRCFPGRTGLLPGSRPRRRAASVILGTGLHIAGFGVLIRYATF